MLNFEIYYLKVNECSFFYRIVYQTTSVVQEKQHWLIFILLIRVTIIYMEIKELKQDSRSNEQSRLYFHI